MNICEASQMVKNLVVFPLVSTGDFTGDCGEKFPGGYFSVLMEFSDFFPKRWRFFNGKFIVYYSWGEISHVEPCGAMSDYG